MAALAIVIRIVIFFLVALGGLFCILATAGNYWTNQKFFRKSMSHSGLWKSCQLGNCASFTNVDDSVRSTRAFMIISVVGYGAAIGFIALIHVKKGLSIRILGGILFATCLCEIIAMSIYTDKVGSSDSYGWSYILGWIAPVVTAVVAVLSIVFGSE